MGAQSVSGVMVRPASPTAPVRRARRDWLPVVLIGPAILFVVGISAYPIADAIDLSLYRTDFANKAAFIGLSNYSRLLADSGIWADAARSAVYTLGSLALVLPYSMGLALLLQQDVPLRGLFRTLAIVPWVFSQTITALLWGWLLNPDFGMAAYIAQTFSGMHLQALATPSGAMATLVFVNVWASYPMAALLFMAALQTIPAELYEAAGVDGATGWKRFWYITEPLLRPTALVVVIQLTLQYLNMVTLLYVLTGGGPLGGTETLALRVLKTSFESWDLGAGSALGVLITAANIILSLIYIRALRDRH